MQNAELCMFHVKQSHLINLYCTGDSRIARFLFKNVCFTWNIHPLTRKRELSHKESL